MNSNEPPKPIASDIPEAVAEYLNAQGFTARARRFFVIAMTTHPTETEFVAACQNKGLTLADALMIYRLWCHSP